MLLTCYSGSSCHKMLLRICQVWYVSRPLTLSCHLFTIHPEWPGMQNGELPGACKEVRQHTDSSERILGTVHCIPIGQWTGIGTKMAATSSPCVDSFTTFPIHSETLGRVETCWSLDKAFFPRRKISCGRGNLWNPAFRGSLAGHFRVTLQNAMSGSLYLAQALAKSSFGKTYITPPVVC